MWEGISELLFVHCLCKKREMSGEYSVRRENKSCFTHFHLDMSQYLDIMNKLVHIFEAPASKLCSFMT